jgi:hypothetical protein
VAFFRTCPLVALACGDFHTLGHGVDGRVYAWGYGAEGQGGLGATLHLRTPRPVEGLDGHAVAQIACGAWWSLVVTAEGSVCVVPVPVAVPCRVVRAWMRPPLSSFGTSVSCLSLTLMNPSTHNHAANYSPGATATAGGWASTPARARSPTWNPARP